MNLNIIFEIFLLIPYLYQLIKKSEKNGKVLNETIKTDSNIYESMQNKFNVEEKIIEVN